MKDNFEKCLDMLLAHEGGFVDHPKDPGGTTNLGVTLATYKQWVNRAVTVGEMKTLTPAMVAPIYKANYWDKVRGDELPAGVDWCAFDWAVNSGSKRPAKAIQRFVGAAQDGAIGPKTLQKIMSAESKEIIRSVYSSRQKFYERLKAFEHFGRGWTRRNKETLEQALHLAE